MVLADAAMWWPVSEEKLVHVLTAGPGLAWVRPASGDDLGWSRGHRVTAGLAVVAGALLQTVEDVLEASYDDPAARFAAMAENSTPFEMAQLFGISALPFLFVTALVLLALARRGSRRLAWVGGVMAFVGFVGLSVLHGIEMVETVALAEGLDVATVVRIDDAVTGSVAAIPVVVMFLSAPVGLVLLSVALWRAGTAPRAALLLLVASLLADFGLLGTMPFPVHAILLVALGWIAWSVVRGPAATVALAQEHTVR